MDPDYNVLKLKHIDILSRGLAVHGDWFVFVLVLCSPALETPLSDVKEAVHSAYFCQ